MLHVRVDEAIKSQAADTLAAMGLTMADAVRLFLHRVVAEQAFPLELKVPNPATQAAMAEARALMEAHQERFTSGQELLNALEKSGR